MSISRYSRTNKISFTKQYGTSQYMERIRRAINEGRIPFTEITLKGSERLDTLAGKAYGDAQYWWVLAVASDIGWSFQVPPGTLIRIPDINKILSIVG